MNMNHKSVNSSFIASIGYDKSRSLLEVKMRDGGVYKYYGVPACLLQAGVYIL